MLPPLEARATAPTFKALLELQLEPLLGLEQRLELLELRLELELLYVRLEQLFSVSATPRGAA